MAKLTINNAETTTLKTYTDALSNILNAMRISGGILLNEDYSPPWAVDIPGADRLRGVMKLGAGVRVVAFHFVKRGYIEVLPEGGERTIIEAGEMAICFGGLPHKLMQESAENALPVEALLAGGKNPFQPERHAARNASLICGVFLLRNVELNPLFASLPPFLHTSALRLGNLHNLAGVLNWMNKETERQTLGSVFVVERLLELLCAEAIRFHLETGASEAGWLSGLKDPVVGRAIAMIHSRPGDNWSVKRLAQGVAMSPSRFAARFSAALTDSPMAYVAKWRMNVAGRLLTESRQGVGEIAAIVGYDNPAAFARTFKRHLGVSPAVWRSRHC
ncbi:MAG: AraC family transcriptional regulator [Methylomonas sp.]|jgi:AraC-like DNA-binding protein